MTRNIEKNINYIYIKNLQRNNYSNNYKMFGFSKINIHNHIRKNKRTEKILHLNTEFMICLDQL